MQKGRDKKSIKTGILLQKSHLILKVEKNSTNQKPSTRNTVYSEVAACTTARSTKHSSQFNRASFTTGSKAHSNMLLCKRYIWKKDWGKRKLRSIHKTSFRCRIQVSSPKGNTTWSNEMIEASSVSIKVKRNRNLEAFTTLGSKIKLSKANKRKNQNWNYMQTRQQTSIIQSKIKSHKNTSNWINETQHIKTSG